MSDVSDVTVVTVTLNNSSGLALTLESLCGLDCKPALVVIQDGGSNDGTDIVVGQYRDRLPIKYIVEEDSGIYDAMNRARKHIKTSFVHYLNAGDAVFGEPYLRLGRPRRILIRRDGLPADSRLTIFGLSYCHQGIIFLSDHADYNLRYDISADFDLILNCFVDGAKTLPVSGVGGVFYDTTGISSIKRVRRDVQISMILFRHGFVMFSCLFLLGAVLRWPLSRRVRTYCRAVFHSLCR